MPEAGSIVEVQITNVRQAYPDPFHHPKRKGRYFLGIAIGLNVSLNCAVAVGLRLVPIKRPYIRQDSLTGLKT